jgi:hypothetical protein
MCLAGRLIHIPPRSLRFSPSSEASLGLSPASNGGACGKPRGMECDLPCRHAGERKKPFLVSGLAKTGLHALKLGVESRLCPLRHEFGVRGPLIAPCSRSGVVRTGSGVGGCAHCSGKRSKELAIHDDAWSRSESC